LCADLGNGTEFSLASGGFSLHFLVMGHSRVSL
jgi:hypothetical protein